MAAGLLLSQCALDLVVATSSVSGIRQRELLGRTVQGLAPDHAAGTHVRSYAATC